MPFWRRADEMEIQRRFERTREESRLTNQRLEQVTREVIRESRRVRRILECQFPYDQGDGDGQPAIAERERTV